MYFVFLSRYIASDLILEFSFIVEFPKKCVTENIFFKSVMATRVEAALRLLPVLKVHNHIRGVFLDPFQFF